ncbi:MAG TPA: hypothetical protein VIL74_17230 [Pyrinomonadaceae bacterium]|jgi:hypothetical protein
MKSAVLLFFVFGFCHFGLFAQSAVTGEEYAVYASLLKIIDRENLKEYKVRYSFVIQDKTLAAGFVNNFNSLRMKGLAEDFKLKNQNAGQLKRLIPVDLRYEIVADLEIDELLKTGRNELAKIEADYKERNLGIGFGASEIVWEPFYQKYPKTNGYYRFSRVGFSASRQFALVELERVSAGSGDSAQYVLQKAKGDWRFYASAGNHWVE